MMNETEKVYLNFFHDSFKLYNINLFIIKGTFAWANGDKYVGDFLIDKRTGKGKKKRI